MAGSEEVVIDASVAVKWFSDEEGTDRALELRKNHVEGSKTLIAPDLLVYEISNALRFKPNFNPQTTRKAVEDLYDLQIDLMVPNKELMVNCSELAFKHGITTYDSSYLALGEFLGIRVITADSQFYKKAKDCGFLSLL